MSDLTEQWKNGQLKGFRWYYVKFKTGKIDSCWLTEWSSDEVGTGGQYFDGIEEENILEVLAPVPSYEEWQSMDRLEKIMLQERARLNKQVIELLEENTKLKEQINKYILDSINRGTANAVTAVKEFGMPERIEELVKKNTKLKELLKECKTPLKVYNEMFGYKTELLTKIEQALGEDK